VQRLLLFHHDPLHDHEQLDRLHPEALARWVAAGRRPHDVLMAAELKELELDDARARVATAASSTAASCRSGRRDRARRKTTATSRSCGRWPAVVRAFRLARHCSNRGGNLLGNCEL